MLRVSCFWRLALACAVALAMLLFAGSNAGAARTGADAAAVKQAEDYLNGIGTLRADFLQVADDGSIARGRLYIARPGRLRLEYDPPVTVVMVSDGDWLTYIDYGLGQTSQMPLGDTPAAVLVAGRVRLSGAITVTRVARRAGSLRLTLVRTKDPEAGSLTLVFSETPFALRQWVVTDTQGFTTRITLAHVERDVKLEPSLFEAPPPAPAGESGR